MKKFTVLLFIPLILLCGCARKQISDTKLYMNTACTVTSDCDEKTLDGVFGLCENYERFLGPDSPDSDISFMNYYDEYEISDDTREILLKTLYYCQKTGGKYDITLTPAIQQWDFESKTLPDFNELNRVLYRVGYDRIEIDGNNVNLHDTDVDLSSIVSGYVTDKIVSYLKKNDAQNGVVNFGSNVKVFGKAYKLEIKKPFSDEIILTAKIKDKALSTCSIDAKYFKKDGKLYHHILDSETGMPIENELSKVIVFGESAAECDVLSTVCMILGEYEGKKLIKETDGYEAVFVLRNDDISVSDGLEHKKGKIIFK